MGRCMLMRECLTFYQFFIMSLFYFLSGAFDCCGLTAVPDLLFILDSLKSGYLSV